MPTHQEMEEYVAALSRGEKAQLLQWVVQDMGEAFPGVESRLEVCGGEACVVRTRIPGVAFWCKRDGLGRATLTFCAATPPCGWKIWRMPGPMPARMLRKLTNRFEATRRLDGRLLRQ